MTGRIDSSVPASRRAPHAGAGLRRLVSVVAVAGVVAAGLALARQPTGVVLLDAAHAPRALRQGSLGAEVRDTCGSHAVVGAGQVHVEVFVDGVGVLLPSTLGQRGECLPAVVTRDATGVAQVTAGATLGDLFRVWGRPVDDRRLLGLRGRVRAYVDGVQQAGPVVDVRLEPGAQVVVEVGAVVPPHASYAFPD